MDESATFVVERLLTILAGRTGVSKGAEIIDQNVISHMDDYTFRGIGAWGNWITFIRSRSRVSELDLIRDRFVVNPDHTISAYGKWVATRHGKRVVSDEVSATYRVKEGLIVEIWTTRTNYTLIFGPMMRYRIGCLLVLLRLWLWSRLTTKGRSCHRLFSQSASDEGALA